MHGPISACAMCRSVSYCQMTFLFCFLRAQTRPSMAYEHCRGFADLAHTFGLYNKLSPGLPHEVLHAWRWSRCTPHRSNLDRAASEPGTARTGDEVAGTIHNEKQIGSFLPSCNELIRMTHAEVHLRL